MSIDLDAFYSTGTIPEWKQVIGDEMHYHFGCFRGNEDLEVGVRQTVRNFYAHIPPRSHVLDVGCGWGGPAMLLSRERGCTVKGLTVATAQVAYCRTLGLDVRRCDVERDPLPAGHDVALLLEVLEHIRDKPSLLHRLRGCAKRLVIASNCLRDENMLRESFGQSAVLCTVEELCRTLLEAGWEIIHLRQRRFESLRSLVCWKRNLDRFYGTTQPPGQLARLRSIVTHALRNPIEWALANPLIDVVADRV